MMKQTENILRGLSADQRRAAAARDCDVILRAGAGSGKTKTLVARYLFLLDKNRNWEPEDITAVTFTRKAAREMQNRIRSEMLRLAAETDAGDGEEKRFWLEKLTRMDRACIGTIHSLCSRILRAHPAEAGLDPDFGVLDENAGELLVRNAADAVCSQIAADPDYAPLLQFYSGTALKTHLVKMLQNRTKVGKAMEIPAEETLHFLTEQVRGLLYGSNLPAWIADYRDLAESADFEKTAGVLSGNILALVAAYKDACILFDAGGHPAECLEKLYSPFIDWNFKKGNTYLKANAMALRDDLRKKFPFLISSDHDIAWFKEYWTAGDAADLCMRSLWPKLLDVYLTELDRMDLIDFDELENRTLRLLREHPESRSLWQDRIKALLVDEFQDTNDEQTELFALLDPAHDRMFAVGDKKQSIYGFRGTNVALFEQRRAAVLMNGGEDLSLDVTYRTDPSLLQPMGSVLEQVMADDDLNGKSYYVPYEAMRTDRVPENDPGPFMEVLIGQDTSRTNQTNFKIVSRMLAQRLSELKRSGVLQNWSDAAVLCRKAKDFKHYEAAFTEWNIPYVTVAGQGFYDRPEIREVKNMLRAAENPFDNAALTGFLLNALIGFTPDMLAELYKKSNSGKEKSSFHQALMDPDFSFTDPERQQKLEQSRKILSELTHLAGQVPVDEVLEKLYSLTGFRTMLASDKTDRAWQNLDKLLLDARKSKLASVSEFLEYLDTIKTSGVREGEAPSDNDGAVHIMTIHKAKGLEFPVTVIANANVDYKLRQPSFIISEDGGIVFQSIPALPRYLALCEAVSMREQAEWLRLFYVAVTRAKKKVIFCGNLPGKNSKSWMKRILELLPSESLSGEEYIGPAFGLDEPVLLVRSQPEPPEAPDSTRTEDRSPSAAETDCSLLIPVAAKEFSVRNEDHAFALTVGKMVHKGLELWRFPEAGRTDSVLEKALEKILLQSDRLTGTEQQAALEKAELLLSRFRASDAFVKISQSQQRWHELPFSLSGKNGSVNGVIDLLMKDRNGYTVIDFKTDELKSLRDMEQAINEHEKQLNGYRRAVRMILGEDPQVQICFLDYCGKVELQPAGKSDLPVGLFEPDELALEDYPEEADWYDGWEQDPLPEPVDLDDD